MKTKLKKSFYINETINIFNFNNLKNNCIQFLSLNSQYCGTFCNALLIQNKLRCLLVLESIIKLFRWLCCPLWL
jgi:hypothetical protein